MSLYTYDNISWNLPLMFCHDELIFVLAEIFEAFKDVKRPTIYSYGAMASPWSGGRGSNIKFFDKKFIERQINKIIEAGFIPTFTFTKPVIKNDTLNDKFANWVLDYGVEHNCEFIITAENLYNHIKEKHPEAKLVASILQGKMEFHNPKKREEHDEDFELNFYNERIEKYHRVVVRPEYNFEKLEKDAPRIKDITKLEILINETCVPNCPYAVGCYSSMDISKSKRDIYDTKCGREEFNEKNGLKKSITYSLLAGKQTVDNLIYNCGIKHLKVQGRHYMPAYLYNLILYYIFNPTGPFQSIYPYIMDRLKYYKSQQITMPIEQKYPLKQMDMKRIFDFK